MPNDDPGEEFVSDIPRTPVVIVLKGQDIFYDLLRIGIRQRIVVDIEEIAHHLLLVTVEHVECDDGLDEVDAAGPFSEHDAVRMIGHEVDLLLGEHLVHGGDALLPVIGEEHERPCPDPVHEELDQVRAGHAAAAEDTLPVPAEEMRREDERIATPGIQEGAEETLRPVEDAVVVDDRIVPLAPLDGREHHPETVPLLDGLALVVQANRVAGGLQHGRTELPQAVVQRADRVQVVVVELPVDLLEGHRIDNHREGGSGDVITGRPDEQAFGRSEPVNQTEQLPVRLVEGQVMLVTSIGEQRVRMIDTDIKGVGGDVGLQKEALQVLRGEVPAERLTVKADLKRAVAVELVQEGGELPDDLVQPGPEIPFHLEITAGRVRRNLLRQDVDDAVGYVLGVDHGARGLR